MNRHEMKVDFDGGVGWVEAWGTCLRCGRTFEVYVQAPTSRHEAEDDLYRRAERTDCESPRPLTI